jgi:hypothetical protein
MMTVTTVDGNGSASYYAYLRALRILENILKLRGSSDAMCGSVALNAMARAMERSGATEAKQTETARVEGYAYPRVLTPTIDQRLQEVRQYVRECELLHPSWRNGHGQAG